jgi:hypothetical protein
MFSERAAPDLRASDLLPPGSATASTSRTARAGGEHDLADPRRGPPGGSRSSANASSSASAGVRGSTREAWEAAPQTSPGDRRGSSHPACRGDVDQPPWTRRARGRRAREPAGRARPARTAAPTPSPRPRSPPTRPRRRSTLTRTFCRTQLLGSSTSHRRAATGQNSNGCTGRAAPFRLSLCQRRLDRAPPAHPAATRSTFAAKQRPIASRGLPSLRPAPDLRPQLSRPARASPRASSARTAGRRARARASSGAAGETCRT